MIGKGKSIAHTGSSMGYGWNHEKGAEVVHSQNLAGENAKQVTEEFRLIQEMNRRCHNNTLSFVLSPTKEDGRRLSNEKLGEITRSFIDKMKLGDRQAIAFVHRDKAHTHIHLYANRIGFDGRAYDDSFIGKRSQKMAEQVALEKGLTTVKEIQSQKQLETITARRKIREIHREVMNNERPKTLDKYMQNMKSRKVEVVPSLNKAGKLQGFRLKYQGHDFKASEVHRSMSGGKIMAKLSRNEGIGKMSEVAKSVKLMGETVELSTNLATSIAKNIIKRTIKKAIDTGIGYGMGY
ncbi:MAG: relaxase/mobilization nuclease domain-containing protein [Pricia sp.]